MIKRVDHITLSIPDMEQGLYFYRDLLGLEVVDEFGWEKDTDFACNVEKVLKVEGTSARGIVLKTNNIFIELLEFRSPNAVLNDANQSVIDHGYTHMAFQVDDVVAEYERLLQAGVRFHSEPRICGASLLCTYGRDPFGNVVEFQEILPDHPYQSRRSDN